MKNINFIYIIIINEWNFFINCDDNSNSYGGNNDDDNNNKIIMIITWMISEIMIVT